LGAVVATGEELKGLIVALGVRGKNKQEGGDPDGKVTGGLP